MSKTYLLERIQNTIRELERHEFISNDTREALQREYPAQWVNGNASAAPIIPKRPTAAALGVGRESPEPNRAPATPPRKPAINQSESTSYATDHHYQQSPPAYSHTQTQPAPPANSTTERVETTSTSKSKGGGFVPHLGIGVGIPILPFMSLGVGTSIPLGKQKQETTTTSTTTRQIQQTQQPASDNYHQQQEEKNSRPFNPPPPAKSDRPFNPPPPATHATAASTTTTTSSQTKGGFAPHLGVGVNVPILPFMSVGMGTSVPLASSKSTTTSSTTTTTTNHQQQPQQPTPPPKGTKPGIPMQQPKLEDTKVSLDPKIAANVAKTAYSSGAASQLAKGTKPKIGPDGKLGFAVDPKAAQAAAGTMYKSGAAAELASGMTISSNGTTVYDKGSMPGLTAAPPALPRKGAHHQLRALRDFEGVEQDDLSFKRGDLIVLTQQLDDNWLEGILHGRTGIFPKSFVEEC